MTITIASRAAAAILAVMSALPASAGTALRMDQLPGTDDVVIRWASDAASPGPWNLLRREVSWPSPPSDALPLDPVADAYMSGLAGPFVALPGEATPTGAESTTVYQLVDAVGGCSNAAYVVRRRGAIEHSPSAALRDNATLRVAFPPWPGLPDARSLLAHWPAVQRVARGNGCGRVELERLPGGGLAGANFALAGTTVALVLPTGAELDVVLAGASDPADPVVTVGMTTPQLPPPTCRGWGGDVVLSPATLWRDALELECGVRGVDWQPGTGGVPDRCTAGLWDESDWLGIYRWAPEPSGWPASWTPTGATVTIFGGQRRHAGSPWLVEAGGGIEAYGGSPAPARSIPGRDAGAAAACRCPDTDGDGRDDCTEALEGTDPADPASVGPDTDRDGVPDAGDVCPLDPDPAQADEDGDGSGDGCDPCLGDPANACVDPDGDGLPFGSDNCPLVANADQINVDGDRWGDACDACPAVIDDQSDGDGDGLGDACDACRDIPNPGGPDGDGDLRPDACDNCPGAANNNQADADADGAGDACDCAPGDPSSLRPVEVTGLRLAWADAARTLMDATWDDTRAPLAPATFEISGGSLAELRADDGFARAACRASQLADATASLARPASDEWMLVRAVGDCGEGTYGDARTDGRGADPRDTLDARAPCP